MTKEFRLTKLDKSIIRFLNGQFRNSFTWNLVKFIKSEWSAPEIIRDIQIKDDPDIKIIRNYSKVSIYNSLKKLSQTGLIHARLIHEKERKIIQKRPGGQLDYMFSCPRPRSGVIFDENIFDDTLIDMPLIWLHGALNAYTELIISHLIPEMKLDDEKTKTVSREYAEMSGYWMPELLRWIRHNYSIKPLYKDSMGPPPGPSFSHTKGEYSVSFISD